VKLATELAFPNSAHTLYILDEPTTGLHNADVKVLLSALDTLIQQGNTVILIEHHLGVIAAADHVIDLGPGSGRDGGTIVASGTPEEIAGCSGSYTGQALSGYLSVVQGTRDTVQGSRFTVHGTRFTEHESQIPNPKSTQPASSIQYPASSIQHPVPQKRDLRFAATSSIEHRASPSPASLPTTSKIST